MRSKRRKELACPERGGGCECNEQTEGLHRGCSCLRQPLSQSALRRIASSPFGEPFGAPLAKSCPRWRGKWHGEAMTKGERLKGTKGFELFPPSVGLRRQLPRKRWRLLVRLTSSNIKPALKGEVANEVSRRGCIGAALVCVNPSVNPPCGVLPAPRSGSLLVRH